MQPIALVGARATPHEAAQEKRLEEVVFETAYAALEDAEVTREEIDSVVLATSDELDGRSISSMLTAAPAGALLKDEIKVTDSGLHALSLGAMRILSGEAELVLIVSWALPTQCNLQSVQRSALEPFIERDLSIIQLPATAFMASAYLQRFNRTLDQLDQRAVQKWSNSRPEMTQLSSELANFIAFPLRAGHVGPAVDGAAAVVLASTRGTKSPRFTDHLWLTGIGWATDTYPLSERTLSEWAALKTAFSGALKQASLESSDIQHFEIEDSSVIFEALSIEALGLAEPGTALDYVDDGPHAPINSLSGDGFNGVPPFCAGLWRLARAHESLRESKRNGPILVHGATGRAAQGHIVAIAQSASEVNPY